MQEKNHPQERKMPEGAKFDLPFLPPKGIDALTYTEVVLLWCSVMGKVCHDRGGRLRYGSQR